MNRSHIIGVCALLTATLTFASAPDVKYTQTTTTKFHGGMSMLMKAAGASGPKTSSIMISGNKQRSDQEKTSTIIDLDREVMINIDHKKKEYTEMTFAEFRAMMDKMKNMMGQQPAAAQKPDAGKIEWKFDVKVDRTGERQTINGYACEKAILTMKAAGEAKPGTTGEAGGQGGMMVTSTQWLTPKVDGWEESMAFWKTFAEKLGMSSEGSMESMLGSNPQLAAAFKRLAEEGKKLNGVPVKTESLFESWGAPAPQPGMEGQSEEGNAPSSMGGLLGGLSKKLGKKSGPGGTSEADRKPVFENSQILESVSKAALDRLLFTAPAEYKLKKQKSPFGE
jgi:hypothetical protein